ncbi:metallopeptidase family protein [Tersicoccus sp. Bi-70]|uniref:metallopeptidase family protein n=1 Tax=Tersicoccus sp. Bi-70 TaxID=1897634 RepID=UPI001E4C3E44|nr:metallopeptidase family protein [Tersicoccus sp. Bi-70]
MVDLSEDDFDLAVRVALRAIPEDLRDAMSNVAVFVAEEPEEPGLLGLYEGTPLTERDSWWDAGSLPDRITIYRGPILAMAATPDDVVDEIRTTVVHEVAHHFGIDDDRLDELGWG